MKLIQGRLDYSTIWQSPDIYLFTGNPIVRRDGALVMGRGAAKQVRDQYPGIDAQFGTAIRQSPELLIHFIPLNFEIAQIIGWFKVKDHWMDPAKLEIIQASTEALHKIVILHEDKTFHMNFPGIGNGQLKYEEVAPILQDLPNNVHLYI